MRRSQMRSSNLPTAMRDVCWGSTPTLDVWRSLENLMSKNKTQPAGYDDLEPKDRSPLPMSVANSPRAIFKSLITMILRMESIPSPVLSNPPIRHICCVEKPL